MLRSLRHRCIQKRIHALYGTQGTRRSSLTTLAIETSCDDTAVAVLCRKDETSTYSLLFNERISSDSREYKGIHPVVTFKGHMASLPGLVRRAIPYIPGQTKPDFVSVTRGPGIVGNLAAGLSTAKGLAAAWDVPLVGVHHMQAHALTPRLLHALQTSTPSLPSSSSSHEFSASSPVSLTSSPKFPFLSLLVSGGHTQLVLSSSLTDHRILAATGDIAIGNLLDQTARVILPPEVLEASEDVMYGRLMESFAFPHSNVNANANAEYEASFTPATSRQAEIDDVPSGYDWTVSLPLKNTRKLAYSFSGIHSRVHDIAAAAAAAGSMDIEQRRVLARHTMRAAFQHLVSRLCLALQDVADLKETVNTVVVAGGVASNKFLMHVLKSTLAARGFAHLDVLAPPVEFCTDNAAMIAWAGMEMFDAGYHTDLGVLPIPRWPMDPSQGSGLLGVDGWLTR